MVYSKIRITQKIKKKNISPIFFFKNCMYLLTKDKINSSFKNYLIEKQFLNIEDDSKLKASLNLQKKMIDISYKNSFLNLLYITLFKGKISASYLYQNKMNNPKCLKGPETTSQQEQDKELIKFFFHDFNKKRKLIHLAPLSFEDYTLQIREEEHNQEKRKLYCNICDKQFTSTGTYRHHKKSKKHKKNKENIIEEQLDIISLSSSTSLFEEEICLFCPKTLTKQHLKKEHNFPPFEEECINYEGLIKYCKKLIHQGACVFCQKRFNNQASAKQHICDAGHARLNIDNFGQFQKFYCWKVDFDAYQSCSEQSEDSIQTIKSSSFCELTNPTLKEVELKRKRRLDFTSTGVVINGKQVGYRKYKNYYKQFLGREITNEKAKYQPSIEPYNQKLRNLSTSYKTPAIHSGRGR